MRQAEPHDRRLLECARAGDTGGVQAALAAGASVTATSESGSTPLVLAVIFGHRDTVRLLLQAGAAADERDMHGVPVLTTAAAFSDAEIVRLLLAAGADVNEQARDGRTALLQAVWAGEFASVVDVLLDAGADPHVADETEGLSAIEWARLAGRDISRGGTEPTPRPGST